MNPLRCMVLALLILAALILYLTAAAAGFGVQLRAGHVRRALGLFLLAAPCGIIVASAAFEPRPPPPDAFTTALISLYGAILVVAMFDALFKRGRSGMTMAKVVFLLGTAIILAHGVTTSAIPLIALGLAGLAVASYQLLVAAQP